MRRRSSLKPQFVIGRSQVSAITSSRKLPSPLTADTVTATHRHMRSSENFATQGAGQGHALPPCLGSYCLQGTYLFIAMISTFLGFSWVMSLFNLSAKAMPGFTSARQPGCSLQRKHWVPSDKSCSALAESCLSETAACRCHLYSGVTIWINPFCVKPPWNCKTKD